MRRLTYERLKEMGACKAGLRKFKQLFGESMKVTLKNVRKLAEYSTTSMGSFTRIRVTTLEKDTTSTSFFDWYAIKTSVRVPKRLDAIWDKWDDGKISYSDYLDKTSRVIWGLMKKEVRDGQ